MPPDEGAFGQHYYLITAAAGDEAPPCTDCIGRPLGNLIGIWSGLRSRPPAISDGEPRPLSSRRLQFAATPREKYHQG